MSKRDFVAFEDLQRTAPIGAAGDRQNDFACSAGGDAFDFDGGTGRGDDPAEFATEIETENGKRPYKSAARLRSRECFVAGTGENGKAGIFGVGAIGGGTLAKEEQGAFGGFDGASVEAGGAKAR